nr:hypothetical protein [Bacillus cereus]
MAEAIQWLNDKIVYVKYEKLAINGHFFFTVEITVYKVLIYWLVRVGDESVAH